MREIPGKHSFAFERREGAAEKLDLHVPVAGAAQLGGGAANGLPPPPDLLAAKAVVEHPQGGPKPPRGHPRPMDELDILRRAHAVQLLGKLLCLPANVLGGE